MCRNNIGEYTLSKLSRDSTVKELFKAIFVEGQGTQVRPLIISDPKDELAEMLIMIQGNPETAQNILSTLMAHLEQMHEHSEQQAKVEMVDSTGEKLPDNVVKLVS